MAVYSFFCRRCGHREQFEGALRDGPPEFPLCKACAMPSADGSGVVAAVPMVRDYRADRPHIAPVEHAHYVPSLGTEISSRAEFNRHLRAIEDKSEQETGYRPRLVAKHRSEMGVTSANHEDPTQQAVDNAMKAARDGGIVKPNKATHNLGFKQSGRGEGPQQS